MQNYCQYYLSSAKKKKKKKKKKAKWKIEADKNKTK